MSENDDPPKLSPEMIEALRKLSASDIEVLAEMAQGRKAVRWMGRYSKGIASWALLMLTVWFAFQEALVSWYRHLFPPGGGPS